MKFTFKTEEPTGNFKSFYRPMHLIKLNKKEVGTIAPDKPHKIRLTVMKADINEDGNPNCEWKWITLAHKSETLKEAKDFINANADAILNKYHLKSM